MDSLYSPNYNLCDDILKSLSKDISFPNVNIREKLIEPDNQVLEVLDILLRNGHIKRPHREAVMKFIIRGTQLGMDFYNDGGYKAQLQRDKLQKQYLSDLNQSVLSTNESIKKTNKIQKLALGGTLFVTIVSCFFQGLTYKVEKSNRIKEAEALRDSIRLIQEQTQRLSNNWGALQQQINSLSERLRDSTHK